MPHCLDCGISYESLGVDLVLADQEWKVLCPEDGILCANCICQRARKHGGTSLVAWISNFDYTKEETL